MCEGVSELKAAVPSTLLHPCSIFQGCHVHLHLQVRKGSLVRSRNLPKVTQLCRCCWPGCWHCRQLGVLRLLPQPVGVRTAKQASQADGPLAACPSPWLSVQLIKWATTGHGQTSGLPSHLTRLSREQRPRTGSCFQQPCAKVSVIGEDQKIHKLSFPGLARGPCGRGAQEP